MPLPASVTAGILAVPVEDTVCHPEEGVPGEAGSGAPLLLGVEVEVEVPILTATGVRTGVPPRPHGLPGAPALLGDATGEVGFVVGVETDSAGVELPLRCEASEDPLRFFA